MSRETVVARRYAKALFAVAQRQGEVSEVGEQLRSIAEVVEQPKTRRFLLHPNIDAADKLRVLESALEGKVSVIVMNLIKLLLTRGRQAILKALADSYEQIAGEATGVMKATVSTPQPLDEATLNNISERFSQLTGKQIVVDQALDASLLGGIRVQIGDTLYDASLAGKLNRLQRTLQLEA